MGETPAAALAAAILRALDRMQAATRALDPADPSPPEADAALGDALAASRAFDWPEAWLPIRDCLDQAARLLLEAERVMATATSLPEAWRAFRAIPRASEAIYPLCPFIPSISRHFLEPARRGDAALLERLAADPGREGVGVMHLGGPPGSRGNASLYVPEDYEPARPMPLVVALHGGSGNGAGFLWSWLRAARGRGVAVLAPTALGDTWSIMEPEIDGPNIAHWIDVVSAQWNIAAAPRLLSGMSDGGSFTYSLGLSAEPPFTHLAPVAGNFHPMLTMAMNPEHVRGLPVRITHGARDWMFPPDVAVQASELLRHVGARVECHVLAGLAHAWPLEQADAILGWCMGDAP
ncbi:phospholipase [Rhodovarius crocodyli]|uniref:Phospholipase n=1 Tax=Rhodovarius crocodyli TaxID=1979269 RepID=A0A437MDQ3_9PROT|nr:phospholipase [Rhodovarius crocodyli]RVT95779.1 phospholipase [Rhodovarius crocodyli]